MTRFGTRISLFAAASLLFANIACTCAIAGTHAGHETTADHAEHHVDQVDHVHHHDAHSEQQLGSSALAHAPQHEADPSCHQVLADCADCGPGVTPTIKQERELRLPWIQWEQGDTMDPLFASVDEIVDATNAPTLSPRAWRANLPALGSPITRKDQLTE